LKFGWPALATIPSTVALALQRQAPEQGLSLSALRAPSLVRRLVILAAAWSLAVLAVAGVALSLFFSQAVMARFDDGLEETLNGLVARIPVENGTIAAPPFTDARFGRAYSGAYWQIVTAERSGPGEMVRSRSLWDHELDLPPKEEEALARTPGEIVHYNSVGPLERPLRVAAMQAHLDGVAAPVIIMAAADRTPVNRDVRTFDTTTAVALVLLGAGLIAAVVVQVRVGLQPLFALQREVTAVRTGRSDRIVGHYPSELEPLAAELNALMAHTQEVVERQRTHVGNLAHALKTPLSVILTEASQRGGPLAEVVTRQAQTMGQQVDHHLRRARAAARTQGQGESTAVAPVVEDLSRTLEKIFRGKLAEIEWTCPEDLRFHGERQDLLEVIGNVMENACQWCVGRVRVSATPDGPRHFLLAVDDDGPGLAPEQRREVLRRGARLDERTPGSGLGLAIVDELARAYGGSVTLGASTLGGLELVIRLPRAET
jgi:signal transduction histidine kinase